MEPITNMKIKLLSTDTRGTPCSECKAYSFPITSELIEDYFYRRELICPKCKTKLDLWNLLIRHFEWGIPSYLYSLVGANDTSAEIIMKPNEVFFLDLEKIGISNESRILRIAYSPQESGLLPIEMYQIRHFIPNKIHLFGKPFREIREQTRVLVTIDWVENNQENELWQNLIEAVEAFSIKKIQSAIIPANVAVESRLTPIISEYLGKIVSKQKVSDFLSTGATYSHQLNILLPLLTTFENFPIMPDFLRGNLNSLRSLRNDLAHKGKLDNIDKPKVANLLCSAILGLTYLNILEKHLSKKT